MFCDRHLELHLDMSNRDLKSKLLKMTRGYLYLTKTNPMV